MAVAVLPDASVTIHVILVIPDANTVGALLVIDCTAQLSAVTGVPRLIPVAVQLVPAGIIIFAGAVIEGGVLSTIVTVAVAVLLLPFTSVTVKVTVFAPTLLQLNEVLSIAMEAIPQLSFEPLFT